MPAYYNQHVFTGHLGADATFVELPQREGQSRKFVANFRVAATKRYSQGNGPRKERTTWFTVKLSLSDNGVSFFTDKLKKGAFVLVEGEPQVDERHDQQGKHWYHYVRANQVEILVDAKPSAKPAVPAEDEDDEPVTHCSDIPEYAAPPRASPPAVPAPMRYSTPATPVPTAPAPAPSTRAEPAIASHRVHPLPDDAHTRFDTANW
jgi:single-stranded DNA-binding protein